MSDKEQALLPKKSKHTPTPTPGNDVDPPAKKSKKEKKEGKKNAYEKFLIKYKQQWCLFNLFSTLGSIGLAVGTFCVVWFYTQTCGNLKIALYLVFALHVVNTIEALLNFTGLEKKLCSGTMLCGFFIFEITVLVYMQVVYFESLAQDCITLTPLLYFWLMSQILVFYGVIVLAVCFIFRKFCQDPDLVEDEGAE